MTQNRLKIKAHSLDLELTGEAAYVEDAYQAIRSVVVQRFAQTLESDQAGPSEKKRSTTQPLYRADGVKERIAPSREMADNHLHLVVCSELYHKVSVLARPDLAKTIFGKVLSADRIDHVYIDEGDLQRLERHFEVGKTLWRELTASGRAVVHGEGP
ncbi:hypothetical protein DV096_06125 [Bradymonadaceae bacterium TMQ3]|uniref:Uncharacterized protein n=1 Tax=Lujinxingia sediminis TaxID=2480984 RepID=A0ABY0CPZ3_9DELT|nr:hypothetical protein [Lujinxingia sediminis]RDV38393.1 hypothetical protein DV096_06125 [Bradymonadaceae bacterium TMQ3]RVU42553.1 hypothetical protein EA187_15290 [Lujinxingia sediminis]TXC76836.1 hypothetical protein FRC91_08930 [Bradymonadales bacterium TMQ1]